MTRPSNVSEEERRDLSIIRTKLHRPRLTSELVTRPRLFELLDRSLEVPLTLVPAPAGYGKSVLVSQWVARQEVPCAWLSLDESDSDLRLFLTYLVAAIETVAPDACPSTRELIDAPHLPPLRIVGGHLINELDAIDASLVLIPVQSRLVPFQQSCGADGVFDRQRRSSLSCAPSYLP